MALWTRRSRSYPWDEAAPVPSPRTPPPRLDEEEATPVLGVVSVDGAAGDEIDDR